MTLASWRQGLGQACPDRAIAKGDANLSHRGLAPSSQRPATNHHRRPQDTHFSPISVSIPTDSLLEDDFLTNINFSKRGSLMFGGKRAFPRDNMATQSSQSAADTIEKPQRAFPLVTPNKQPADPKEDAAVEAPPATPDEAPASHTTEAPPATPRSTPNIRVLSADVERESQKVRSLYEVGDAIKWEQGAPPVPASSGERLSSTPEDPVNKDKHDTYDFLGSQHCHLAFFLVVYFQLLMSFFLLRQQTTPRRLYRTNSTSGGGHFHFRRLFPTPARLGEARV